MALYKAGNVCISCLLFRRSRPPSFGRHLRFIFGKRSVGEEKQIVSSSKRIKLVPISVENSKHSKGIVRLGKPLVFTLMITGCSFGGAAIWQYERVRSQALSVFKQHFNKLEEQFSLTGKRGPIRQKIHDLWYNLSEGQRIVSGIIAINFLVILLWRVPRLQLIMVKYFSSNPASTAVCWPMLLSTFSHYSFLHFAANMYVLWSFSTSIVNIMGKEQFLAFYLSTGVISSFASYIHKVLLASPGVSIGASGAIMGVLGAVCTQIPNATLAIIFLPMVTFTAGSAIKGILLLDTTGVLLNWKFFDHAAHLGGCLFGIWYISYGQHLIWRNREPVMKWWHSMREGSTKK